MPALPRLMLRLEDECLGNQMLSKMFCAEAPKQMAEHLDWVRWKERGAVQGLSPSPVLAQKGEHRPLP